MEFSSTRIRKRGVTDFLTSYEHNCILQDTIPLKLVKDSYQSNCLALDVSKLRYEDWSPLLNSLATAKTIQKIRFSSSWLNSKPVPVIHQEAAQIQTQIANSLKKLFSKKNDLNELSFEHFPIKGASMTALGEALLGQFCEISSLSLRDCSIGDLGYSRLQNFLRGNSILRKLDVSSCDLSAVAMSMIVDTLKSQFMMGHGKNWEENLREEERNVSSTIGSSVVALFSSISEDDIRCLERVELRNCGIPSNREVDYALRELIENVPQKLSVFDLRQNPILDNDTSRALVQLLMATLIENHPNDDYESLTGSRTSFSPKNNNNNKIASAKINTNLKPRNLSATYEVIPVPSAKQSKRKPSAAHKKFPNSAETGSDSDLSDDFELEDMEFIDLPGSSSSSPNKAEKTDWEKLYNEEKEKRKDEERKNKLLQDKFQLMSKRMTEMEEIVSAKNTEIRHLKEDQIGHVLVDENFLENIEATFSKFQGFLQRLNNLGISEIQNLPDFQNLIELTSDQ
ncbi:Oidioi.mRNA.OKI2018_I69.chr1.g287.t1.cds [Oikopleura dioica]|uniref:Oidioi.mRNA.OKI2018_I69.chr1.g287.t1.cds n=1 Tax=Oikopleura dioica TaxID=34765 RepID=A0ABN7SJD5_OIKDI|nr:Oidioi.mRNA.OKI2018_I69.chr1.g287.t1.cds [Oikopleura dioica]